MGQGVKITHTRLLNIDDAGPVSKMGYKALVENGLLGVDYDESSFYCCCFRYFRFVYEI